MSALLPLDFPPLVAMAQAMAADLYAADDRVYALRRMPPLPKSVRQPLPQEINRCAVLLADLSRRASQDEWMTWLASETACFNDPADNACGHTFGRNTYDDDWTLANAMGTGCTFGDGPDNEDGDYRHVPGIRALADPAEALRAAVLAVWVSS